jgi:Protein of unknown function (DUF3309)
MFGVLRPPYLTVVEYLNGVSDATKRAEFVDVPNLQVKKERFMFTILLIVLVLMLVGALPTWPHSRNWGYYPSGGLSLVLVVVVVLILLGRV